MTTHTDVPRLLIVEDEATVAEIIARAFSIHGFVCDIVRATTGEEGLEFYSGWVSQGEPVAGIMVDHGLPGMHGDKFLEEVQHVSAQYGIAAPPAVYMSGYDLKSEGAALTYCTLEFLYKPFSVSDILPLARDFFKLSQ